MEIDKPDFFPICIDNFYNNPDKIRELALAQEYKSDPFGNWPGKRSKAIHFIDKNLQDQFVKKLLSFYFDMDGDFNWFLETEFQIVEKYSDIRDDAVNKGWIHTDGGGGIIAGVVFLSPNADPNTGTSLYELVNKDTVDLSDTKRNYYSKRIKSDNYDEIFNRHTSSFKETVRFNNVYNRLIAWPGEIWHGVNSFYSEEPRLTQVFFLKELRLREQTPIKRFEIDY